MTKRPDEEVGDAVERLEPSSPLNQLLAAYQLAFNEPYEKLMRFLDEKLHWAVASKFHGWLDIRVQVDGDKLTVRRRVRQKNGGQPARGAWTLPLTPTVLAEFFERIKQEPPAEKRDADVDMSQADPAPPPSAAEQLRARAREVKALLGNIDRTIDEMKRRGEVTYTLNRAIEMLHDVGQDLEDAAAAADPETLQ